MSDIGGYQSKPDASDSVDKSYKPVENSHGILVDL
jgi:hypothetical protein